MNRIRCLLLGAMVVISSSTLALGGEMQGPGKSEPTPTPSASSSTQSATDDMTTSIPTEEIQIVLQEATTMLLKILLTIY